MFSTERMPQLLITDTNVKWPLCLALAMLSPFHRVTKNSRRNVSAIDPVTMENRDDSHLQT